MTPLTLHPFARHHYPAYARWFADDRIDDALGPMDEDWLAYVLHDDEGVQYAVSAGDLLVGVVGLVLGDADHDYPVITDLAVRPDLIGSGVGSRILDLVYERHPLPAGRRFVTYVATRNQPAQRFFERNGWEMTAAGEQDGMLEYGRVA